MSGPERLGDRTTTCSICGVTSSLRPRGLSCVSLDLTKGDRIPPPSRQLWRGFYGLHPPRWLSGVSLRDGMRWSLSDSAVVEQTMRSYRRCGEIDKEKRLFAQDATCPCLVVVRWSAKCGETGRCVRRRAAGVLVGRDIFAPCMLLSPRNHYSSSDSRS